MKIAICDDENIFVKKLYQYFWKQHNCSVECFTSPLELLEKYHSRERYDVLFLDILMEPLDGIRLAREIRKYDQKAIIVFLTSSLEYAPLGYEVNAFRYLLKPVTQDDLSHTMREILKHLSTPDILHISTPECEILVNTDELHYLEANNKDCILYYMGDTITVRKSLSELEEMLSGCCFFRIHRKYLVNLSCVREFDDRKLTLDCGKTLPIGRRRSVEFRNILNKYIEGNLNK